MARFLGLKTESDKLRNLDFLRFIASIAIVFHHSHEFFYSPIDRMTVVERSDGLALFVDLFFMISGFVMAFVYGGRLRTAADYFRFLWRRVARLYPLHLLVLLFNIALWAVLLTAGQSDSAPSFAPACILTEAMLAQEYFDCGSPYRFNGVTWSISVEMGMYVILPVLVFLAKMGTKWLFAASALSILLAFYLLPVGGEWLDVPRLARGLAGFTFGCLLFQVRRFVPDLQRADVLVLALTGMIVAEMLLGAPQIVSLLTLAALALVAVSADNQSRVHPIVETICPLGQLTYSMYIWHRLLILAFLNVVADKLFPGNLPILITMTLLTYISVFGVSYIGYFMVEVPARRWLSSLAWRRIPT